MADAVVLLATALFAAVFDALLATEAAFDAMFDIVLAADGAALAATLAVALLAFELLALLVALPPQAARARNTPRVIVRKNPVFII